MASTAAPKHVQTAAPRNGAVGQAEHPKDRWDMAYVWAFICKFTNLRQKVQGLDSVMDLEEAVLFPGPTPVLEGVLLHFIRICRPNSHTKLEAATIHKHLNMLFAEKGEPFKDHVWYDDKERVSKDPLAGIDDVFKAPWTTKLDILRQLVDWALVTCPTVKEAIDATRLPKPKTKKTKEKGQSKANGAPDEKEASPEDPAPDPILIEPIGCDTERRRYWILDYSGRMYRSGNPWKNACPFNTISSSREELEKEVVRLEEEIRKADASRQPPPRGQVPMITKWESSMRTMARQLREETLPKVEAEEARLLKLRRKAESRQVPTHQYEFRTTRTRRQTVKPNYVYDDYAPEEDDDEFIDSGDAYDSDRSAAPRAKPTRQSGRIAAKADVNDKAPEWRGERRSGRFGGPILDDDDDDEDEDEDETPAPKPSAAAKPSGLVNGNVAGPSSGKNESEPPSPDFDDEEEGARRLFESVGKGKGPRSSDMRNVGGLAKPKGNEIVLEALGNKKKSKFWFYAVEPVAGPVEIPPPPDVRRPRKKKTLRIESPEQSEGQSPAHGVGVPRNRNEDFDMDGGEAPPRPHVNGNGKAKAAFPSTSSESPLSLEDSDEMDISD